MSRGGHNWKGGGTVDGTRSIDVMTLARAGYLAGSQLGTWQWRSTASVLVIGGRDAVTLKYQIRGGGEDWQPVKQQVPVRWTPMDRAHHRLARLHRKLSADYDGPDMPPPKPKWMRWKTYAQIAQQIETGQERLDVVFNIGARRLLDRLEKSEHRRRK
ncbi:MAG TPA: hypothetical protein VKI44_34175 [Acetobacteraceae bacterium]|nr:hypothetical protein [Acetobacteraceae bacterium]